MSLSNTLKIRKYMDGDLETILKIEDRSYPDPWSRNLFMQAMGESNCRVFVAELNKTLVGYVVFWRGVEEVHLMNLAVDPGFRSMGYGKALFNYFLDYYPEDEVKTLLLEVRTNNSRAIKLYRSAGFEDLGIRKGYYKNGGDALVMIKRRC